MLQKWNYKTNFINIMNNYYVYVYIDPRNFEEFYYGKGQGSRKYAHLSDSSESKKSKRIAEIKKEGLEPIIRVIAKDLDEKESLLIEKTLLWKLGKWTENIATGHFANKFRPKNTLYRELPGFDFQNGIYFYNIGEGPHRSWSDYIKYGFISAGQGYKWRDSMLGFSVGDIIFAYTSGYGYIGIGIVETKAKRINEVKIINKSLLDLKLKCKNMSDNEDDIEKSEYVCLVKWIKTLPFKKAIWKSKLFVSRLVRASMEDQQPTINFLEKSFDIKLKNILE